MYKYISCFILSSIILICFSSCTSKIAYKSTPPGISFTQEMRERYNFTDEELKGLQYFSNGSFILRRILSSSDKEMTRGHKLKMIDGQGTEEIEFNTYTPGIAVNVYDRGLDISFEPDLSLLYGRRKSSESTKDTYVLMGIMKKGPSGSEYFAVKYGKHYYRTISTSPQYYSTLLVNAESLHNVIEKRRTVPGRSLD